MTINYAKLAAVLTASGATGIDEFNLQHAVALAEDTPKITIDIVRHTHTETTAEALRKTADHNSRITRNPSIQEWAKGGLQEPAHRDASADYVYALLDLDLQGLKREAKKQGLEFQILPGTIRADIVVDILKAWLTKKLRNGDTLTPKRGTQPHEAVISILTGTREEVTKFAEDVDIDPAAYARSTLEEFAAAVLLQWAYFQRP